MMKAEWLPVLMEGAFSEIYVVDYADLRFVHANRFACENLGYSAHELTAMNLLELTVDLKRETVENIFRQLANGSRQHATLKTLLIRKDGARYAAAFRLFYCASDTTPVCIAIGNAADATQALAEDHFRSIVTNTPGLSFQLVQRADGRLFFPYLSDSCQALLGVDKHQLRAEPSLFLDLIFSEDRQSCLDAMTASAAEMKVWNWEGRIRVAQWNDIKWINIRSTPRALPGEGVQWEGIMTNITLSKREEAEIKRSREQLAELSAHVETVKEKERTRIAREIHDDLGGNLTAIKMAMALIRKRLPPDDTTLIEKADYVDALVDRTIESIHRISVDLRPGILDFGIVAAIDWQAKEFEKQLGIPCHFSSNMKDIDLDPDQSAALFRIFQEALTNIGKHANATMVKVQLTRAGRSVRLNVADNGRGIANTDKLKPKSFGIRGMMERANALGGQLSVSSPQNSGTEVSLRIPLHDNNVKAMQ